MEVSGAVRLALDPSALVSAIAKAVRPLARPRDPLVLGLALLTLGLVALRFVQLSSWSLWLDEALTLADVEAGGELNPLGYRLFGWFYGLFPGRPDETLLRLPAAFFGLASVAATAWAFRRELGARAAAVAAFAGAAAAWRLCGWQNARFYTLAQTLALLGGGALLRGLHDGSTRRTLLGLVLLGLSALTHPSAAFLIGPLLCVPWAARWLDWIPSTSARSRAWSLFSTAGLLALMLGSGWALRAWFRWEARQGAASPLHLALTAGYLIGPALGLAFVVGVVRQWRTPRSFMPLTVTVLALLAATLASLFLRVSAQYVFVLLPWVAGCAALAVVPREERPESVPAQLRAALLVALVALPGLVESALYFAVRRGDRPRWREAYSYVFEHRGPLDLVLGMEAPVAEYYLDPDALDLRDWRTVTWLDDWRSRLPMEWARYGRRVWFVLNRSQLDDWTAQPTSRENRAEFERMLREECVHLKTFEVPLTPRDLDVHVYVTRGPSEPAPAH